MKGNLKSLERDVGVARARLADDIAHLKSPETVARFKDQITGEITEAKDALIEKATRTAKESARRFYADVTERVRANPAAALSISAGVAWHLLRQPPITTALVGLGVYSLMRTPPTGAPEGVANRFRSQVEEFGDVAAEKTKEWAEKAGEGIDNALDSASEKLAEIIPPENLEKVARIANDNDRDQVLLYAAGLSVAAAIGMALRRR
jgi:hypothetical protein